MKYRVTLESLILVAICLTDMLVTLYYVMTGIATEQNPIMAACINRSPVVFVLVKLAQLRAIYHHGRDLPETQPGLRVGRLPMRYRALPVRLCHTYSGCEPDVAIIILASLPAP